MQRARDATDIGSVDVQRDNDGRRRNRRRDPVSGVLVLEHSMSAVVSVALPLSKARGQRDARGVQTCSQSVPFRLSAQETGRLSLLESEPNGHGIVGVVFPKSWGSGMTGIVQRERELDGRGISVLHFTARDRRMAYYYRLFVPSLSLGTHPTSHLHVLPTSIEAVLQVNHQSRLHSKVGTYVCASSR